MSGEYNPYLGKIARTYDEMARISEQMRKYEGTGDALIWVDVKTREQIFTNL